MQRKQQFFFAGHYIQVKTVWFGNFIMTQFENYILWKNTLLHKSFLGQTSKGYQHEKTLIEDAKQPTSKFARWFWWEPSQDSWLNEFCGSSVIHGLKYLSKRRLSAVERIFWVAAFIASLYVSWLMIIQVWDRYHKNPVIVSFNPSEKETYQLPFPAVTICNKSLFHKSKIEELIRELESGVNREKTLESLRLVNALCSSRQSFLRRMHLVKPEKFPELDDVEKPPSQETVDETVKFIFDHTQSCEHFLRSCSWEQRIRNCSDLFKPIITDYGKCCVFNKIPNELMKFEVDEIDGTEKRERGWSFEEVNSWSLWNYWEDGFIIQNGITYPLRQKRAGSLKGLSVLVDPDVADGFCQSQDSQGIRILLHTPLDAPRISNMGTGFGLDRETFIKVYPDLTVADKSILDYNAEQRGCIFGYASKSPKSEIEIPYTRNNCYLICQQRHIRYRCNCTLHYARRKRGVRVCNPAAYSQDFGCIRMVESGLAGHLRISCPKCVYACNHIKYNVETTEASLLDKEELWSNDETNQPAPPHWADHKLSILHVFMGSDTNVPKVRQKLYGQVDLIASIGGLLGLTLGFSVLSAIEILYLLTLRMCCKRFRKWHLPPSTTN